MVLGLGSEFELMFETPDLRSWNLVDERQWNNNTYGMWFDIAPRGTEVKKGEEYRINMNIYPQGFTDSLRLGSGNTVSIFPHGSFVMFEAHKPVLADCVYWSQVK